MESNMERKSIGYGRYSLKVLKSCYVELFTFIVVLYSRKSSHCNTNVSTVNYLVRLVPTLRVEPRPQSTKQDTIDWSWLHVSKSHNSNANCMIIENVWHKTKKIQDTAHSHWAHE